MLAQRENKDPIGRLSGKRGDVVFTLPGYNSGNYTDADSDARLRPYYKPFLNVSCCWGDWGEERRAVIVVWTAIATRSISAAVV